MTVAELIEALKAMPQGAEVFFVAPSEVDSCPELSAVARVRACEPADNPMLPEEAAGIVLDPN